MEYIFVNGIHRGGTTIVGNIISKGLNFIYVHEPLNKNYGLKNVHKWYCDEHDSEGLVKLILSNSLLYKRGGQTRNKFYKLISYIIPSITYLKVLYLNLISKKNVVVKDPFSSFLIKDITKHNKNIFVLRDPYLFYESIIRKKWDDILPIDDLLSNKESNPLIDKYKCLLKESSSEKKIFLYWGLFHEIMFEKIKSLSKDSRKRLFIVSHTNLCISPYQTFSKMFLFFERDMNNKSLKLIKSSFFSDVKIDVKNEKTHNLKRNSNDIVKRIEVLTKEFALEKNVPMVESTYNRFKLEFNL